MTIQCRLAVIGTVDVNAVNDASVVQFGDSRDTVLIDSAIALQRRYANFQGDETRFASYPIFSLPAPPNPWPVDGMLISRSQGNRIEVGAIRVLSIRASSYLQAGCLERMETDSRILNIRQFNHAATWAPPATAL